MAKKLIVGAVIIVVVGVNGFSRGELEDAMEGHILGQGQLMGKFSK